MPFPMITTGVEEELSILHKQAKQPRTYILAPNFSTAPGPKGHIKLGCILSGLEELVPLNRGEVMDVSENEQHSVQRKSNFVFSPSKAYHDQPGSFAGVLRSVSRASSGKNEVNTTLSCDTLETTGFDPTPVYIQNSMDAQGIKSYMQDSQYKLPVYMVTGLKVARGLKSYNSQIERRHLFKKVLENESWEVSADFDFVVGFTVHKIWYHFHNSFLSNMSFSHKTHLPELRYLEASISSLDKPFPGRSWKEFDDEEGTRWMVPRDPDQ